MDAHDAADDDEHAREGGAGVVLLHDGGALEGFGGGFRQGLGQQATDKMGQWVVKKRTKAGAGDRVSRMLWQCMFHNGGAVVLNGFREGFVTMGKRPIGVMGAETLMMTS